MANKMISTTIESRIEAATTKKPLEKLFEMVKESHVMDTDAAAAERYMSVRNVDVSKFPDAVKQGIYAVTNALENKEYANIQISKVLGVIKASGHYKKWQSPNGRKYKDFKEFCAAVFPEYSYKSLVLYADVGTYIYVPVAAGLAGYEKFAELAAFPPSKLKNLVAVFKDTERLAKLPKALPAADKIMEMSQRDLEKAAAATKSAADGRHSTDTPEDEEQRKQLLEFSKMFLFGKSDAGELECLIPKAETAKKTLETVASSPDAAIAFVKWFASNIK